MAHKASYNLKKNKKSLDSNLPLFRFHRFVNNPISQTSATTGLARSSS
ncbi:hypothetical protein SX4_3131 [Vibrio mimicus SX-4]|nr:hypothetical protein SX4_3131 [Vibrio mimicus SX-4]ERM52921.1 hypothetical protein P780_18055 [Vibrio mimicus CAIM 1882]ERM53113.1 hypothetical protein P781_18005 [Vibrio mimicus CAIM 1883]